MNKLSSLFGRKIQLKNVRFLHLQEFQSKQLLRQGGCTVQNFFVANSENEAQQQFSKHSKRISKYSFVD